MRLRLFLAMTVVLVLVADLTVVLNDRLGAGDGSGASQVVAAGGSTTTTGATTSSTTAATSPTTQLTQQASATGTATAVHLEGAQLDDAELATPLTLDAEPGFGNGVTVSGVSVDATPSVIAWDGGRPFVLSSGGGLLLGVVTVDLDPAGLRVSLTGGQHHLVPGTYQLDTPVAVGAGGVATPAESLSFVATSSSTIRATGNTSLLLLGAPRHFVVRGALHLEGALSLTDSAGTRLVGSLDASDGLVDVVLTPSADGGWSVTAVLQGEVTTTGR